MKSIRFILILALAFAAGCAHGETDRQTSAIPPDSAGIANQEQGAVISKKLGNKVEPLHSTNAAQFVEVTVALESSYWSNEGVATYDRLIKCVVGTNAWLLAPERDKDSHQERIWLFDGSSLKSETLVVGYPSKHPDLYERNHPDQKGTIGRRFTNVVEWFDGNPGRPVRMTDVTWALETKIAFWAFCSSSLLVREGRQIYPPSDLWKQWPGAPEFTDTTVRFQDALGLPERLVLNTGNGQRAFEYRVAQSTNVLGWNFPLVFHAAQYRPVGGTSWELHFMTKGEVVSIGPGAEPAFREAPEEGAAAVGEEVRTVRVGQAVYPVSTEGARDRVQLEFLRWADHDENSSGIAVFRLSNHGVGAVLIFNERVEKVSGEGGRWETIRDGYPGRFPARLGEKDSIEVTMPSPTKDPWRVRLLYSRADRSADDRFVGNYEAESPAIQGNGVASK